MREAFPGSCMVGCSTAGEIAGGKMLSGSVAAMFLGSDIVEDAAAVVANVRCACGIGDALRALEEHFQAPLSSLDLETHVGLVLMDGLSGAEERIMETLGDRTDLLFVGGSAGDDLQFRRTYLFEGGEFYTDAAVLAVLRLKNGFDILKTQSFRSTGKVLTATKVDGRVRKVIEFNHKPALQAYAETLGMAPEAASTHFFQHPLGLMVSGDPFVRSPQRVEEDGIVFYCEIKEDADLELLEATEIVEDTRAALEARKAALGEIRGLIDFQCILRTLELREDRSCDRYGALFGGIPTAGFSTYGEAYVGHMNQTSTMLLFR
jgi:hypothetical protein